VLAVASALLAAIAIPPEPFISGGPAPGSQSAQPSATFRFFAPGRDVAFECSVDSTISFSACVSPHNITGLAAGEHTFRVRVVEGKEAGPYASRTWTVLPDADGDGFSPPADCDDANAASYPGAIEIPYNGVDEDCSGADYAPVIVIPPITLPTPVPTATPTPTPTPQAAKPKIAVTLSYFMNARKRETRFSTLSVKGVPQGATVKVTCRGGCPRRSQTISKGGTVALTAYRRKAIKVGATLTIAVTKPGMTGIAKVVTIRSGKRPRITTKLLS
jgi:hypothetical protein